MFSLPWYAWLAGLVIAAIGLVLASLIWQHGRAVVPNNVIALAVSWGALPIAYFVGSLGLLIIARSSVSMSYSGTFGDSELIRLSAGLAAWTPLLALLAGIIVELLSRFAAPLVGGFLPAALLGWFRKPLAPALAGGVTGVTAAPVGLAGASAPQAADVAADSVAAGSVAAQPVAAPAAPLSPRAKKLMIGGGIAVAGGFALLIGAAIAFNVVSSTVFSPEKQVEAYLGAMQDGDASTVRELSAPNVPTAQQVLLTDAIAGAAENRISGYEIVDTEEAGEDRAVVTAKVTQDGVTSTRTFVMERTGRTAVLFPKWEMGETEYAYVDLMIPAGVTTLMVNGQEVPVESLAPEDGYAAAVVLPGTYEVTLPEVSDLVAAESSTVAVPADPEGWYELYAAPSYTLSESGLADVQTQVDAAIDECATSTDAEPENCELGAFVYNMVEGSGSWTIDSYPTLTVEPTPGGWAFGTDYQAQGEATYSYKQTGWDDEVTDETASSSISVSGTVAVTEDGSLAVELDDGGAW